MSNKNTITYGAKVSQIEQVYYGPVSVIPPSTTIPVTTTYCFLSKAEPWEDDLNPPVPNSDQKAIKQIFKNMFVAKKIKSNDISPVIERIDWSNGTIYDIYRDDIDVLEKDVNGYVRYHFYVKNSYDQVFKCLWNNNDDESTDEPYFEPGSYDTNNIFKGSDGYKWKYIYTIDPGKKVKFMDSEWMPVPVGANTPNPLVTSAGAGSIDSINVINGGSGYDPGNSVITVVVTGDGTGAAAVADISGGVIQDILITNPGTNYTYTEAHISSTTGSGAVLQANSSPIGGHGFDPISELGCAHVMYTCEFNGDEDGAIPTDIDFHQLGLLINPTTQSRYLDAKNDLSPTPYPANGDIYRTTTDVIVAPGFGEYESDEFVYQGGLTIETATFTARVLSFDTSSNVVKLINISGSPITNAPLFSNTSKTTRTLLTTSEPNFTIHSGYISFIENRTGVTRSADGIEQIRFVLGY